jgi:hypothetical protein
VTSEEPVTSEWPAAGQRPAGFGIEEAGRLLGAYAWVEGRLFAVLGAWAADEKVPEAAVLLDAHSRQHAWHASLLTECLPLVPALGDGAVDGPPGQATSGALEKMAAADGSAGRMAGLARVVLPRLVTGYRRHLANSRPMSDAPVVRALRLVLRDEIEALVEAEELLETLLAGHGSAGEALRPVADLEGLLAASGPGLVPWPAGSGGPPGGMGDLTLPVK